MLLSASQVLPNVRTSQHTLINKTDNRCRLLQTYFVRVVQGDGDFKHLTALQELRIGIDAAVHTFNLHLHSLPPSLRRLSVSHGVEPPYGTPQLLAIAPPTVPETRPGASEPSRARLIELCKAAAAQHPAPALPELLSLVLRCPRAGVACGGVGATCNMLRRHRGDRELHSRPKW